jgi:ATP-dependent helicase/nuclease subunit A
MTLALSPDAESRQRAVAALDSTILVEAGAGSGKTAVLTSRLLSLLRSGRGRIERIAAITFSEKAASEMRLRLRAELDTALAGPLTEDERTTLRAARVQLDRAQISTIHAFCAALLRERPVEARVDPNFTVLDSVETSVLQSELWRAWLILEMERSPAVLKQALQAKLSLTHLETLRDFLVAQRDCLDWLPAPLLVPLAEMQELLASALTQLNELKASCRNPNDRACKAIRRVAMLLPVGGDDAAWERLLLREPREVFASPTVGAKTNWRPASALNEVRALLGQMSEVYTRARAAWFHNLTVELARWLEGYLRAYHEKKRDRSQLDFTDLLVVTRDLLKTNLDVRRYFQHKFDFLCVDELQDTDPLQAEIVFFLAEREPRAKTWTEVDLHPGKLFLVGDPQQAIYRFRRADVDVYTQVRTAIERQGEVLTLFANFRTRAPVLTWINETFARAFTEGGDEQPSYRPLTATRHENTGREVILVPVPAPLLSPQVTRDEQREAEAQTVATFLKQSLAYGNLAVWGDRQVHYRDIAILFRTYQAMDFYEDALRGAGVPYRIFGGRRYSSRPEIEECRALLLAIERPSETAALVAALRSSAFGFSDEELALFVSMGGKLDYLHAEVSALLPMVERFHAAFAVLRELHAQAAQVSPATLLSTIYDRTPMIPVFALQPHGAQQVANLLKLVDLARSWSIRGLRTLAAFNRFLAHQDIIEEEQEAVITEEHEDAVRLLTIHKAKGLEFPVVILADMASQQRGRGRRPPGIVERVNETLELQIGPRALTCTTQGWQKADIREQARDIAEEQRLWYVAAARVRDHLIIPLLPPLEQEDDGARQIVTDAIGSGREAAAFFGETEHVPVYTYESDPQIIRQTMTAVAPASLHLHVAPHTGALHMYTQWQEERQVAFARGSVATAGSVPDDEKGVLRQPVNSTFRRFMQETMRQALREQHTESGESASPDKLTTATREMARFMVPLLTSTLMRRARAATERYVALPLVFRSEPQTVRGEIDLAFIEDEAWIVAAVGAPATPPQQQAQHEEALRVQLAWQAVALEQLTGRPVKELMLVNVQTHHEQSFRWSEALRLQLTLPDTPPLHSGGVTS